MTKPAMIAVFLGTSFLRCSSRGARFRRAPGGGGSSSERMSRPRLVWPTDIPTWATRRAPGSLPALETCPGTAAALREPRSPNKKSTFRFFPGPRHFTTGSMPPSPRTIPRASVCRRAFPRMYATSFPFQIYQLPDRILFVFEGGAHMWRVVYMDGRKHTPPDKLNPTYLGEGIGHWDGDTLVVDVTGLNDRSWLDAAGHAHTEQLHVTERFTRVNELILHYQATIDDPGAYANLGPRAGTSASIRAWNRGNTSARRTTSDLKHLVGR